MEPTVARVLEHWMLVLSDQIERQRHKPIPACLWWARQYINTMCDVAPDSRSTTGWRQRRQSTDAPSLVTSADGLDAATTMILHDLIPATGHGQGYKEANGRQASLAPFPSFPLESTTVPLAKGPSLQLLGANTVTVRGSRCTFPMLCMLPENH